MTEMDDDRSEQLDQLQPDDTLDDRGVEDVLDEGYSPAERGSVLLRHGGEDRETLDERLAEEEPEVWEEAASDGDDVNDGEVGDRRAGRLVDPNEGIGEDTEKAMVGDDVGIDGAAASAEEAAMHVIDDEEAH